MELIAGLMMAQPADTVTIKRTERLPGYRVILKVLLLKRINIGPIQKFHRLQSPFLILISGNAVARSKTYPEQEQIIPVFFSTISFSAQCIPMCAGKTSRTWLCAMTFFRRCVRWPCVLGLWHRRTTKK